MKLPVFCALALMVTLSEGIHLAAFNIRTLGKTKMSKPEVVKYLVKIIDRYDLVVIQEYRDVSGEAIVDLLNAVNEYSDDTYDVVLGNRAGRSVSYKEQYVFMYKKNALTITGSYNYVESYDEFEREPFIVRVRANSCAEQKDFAVVAIHTKPDRAVAEIDYLADVYDDVVNTWKIKDVAIVGDFNADCNYVREWDWPNIRLRNQSGFHWLIPDEADTSVNKNLKCAYDRLVVTGNLIHIAQDPSVFYFDDYYNLTTVMAGDISDHYPVEMMIDHGCLSGAGNRGSICSTMLILFLTLLSEIYILYR